VCFDLVGASTRSHGAQATIVTTGTNIITQDEVALLQTRVIQYADDMKRVIDKLISDKQTSALMTAVELLLWLTTLARYVYVQDLRCYLHSLHVSTRVMLEVMPLC
jgi:hypothetical protein